MLRHLQAFDLLSHRLSKRDCAAAQAELDKALEAFGYFDRAKEINTEGGWKNWYRGELKMNFAELLKLAKSAREIRA